MKQTSILAHESIKPTKESLYLKIKQALNKINSGSFRDIANHLGLKDEQVWKRLSELEKLEIVEIKGTKICEVSKRKVSIYKLKIN
jgi:DNA-binding Lrp family transcriptional regulator